MTTLTREQAMDVEIVALPAMKVAGVLLRSKPMSAAIPQLWGTFDAHARTIPHVVRSQVCYGLCDNMDEQTGEFDYLAAVEVAGASDMPAGITVWEVPAATYAVFPTTLPEIGAAYDRIYGQWLPASGYQRAPGPDIEVYGENFNAEVAGSIFHLYVPVSK